MRVFILISFLLFYKTSFSQDSLVYNKSYDNIYKDINCVEFNVFKVDVDSFLLVTEKDMNPDYIIQYKIDKKVIKGEYISFKVPRKGIQIFIYKDKILSTNFFFEIEKSVFK